MRGASERGREQCSFVFSYSLSLPPSPSRLSLSLVTRRHGTAEILRAMCVDLRGREARGEDPRETSKRARREREIREAAARETESFREFLAVGSVFDFFASRG